jgi:DNA invertase Pin-like site-specific DNA recombinase
MSSKIVGYPRVSTAGQAENGHSIDSQRGAINREANRRGWEILWVEDAASGKDLERPGMTYALHLLATGQATGIVASRLDRLSRSVLDFATLLARARAEGWNVVILDLGVHAVRPVRSPRPDGSRTAGARPDLRAHHPLGWRRQLRAVAGMAS